MTETKKPTDERRPSRYGGKCLVCLRKTLYSSGFCSADCNTKMRKRLLARDGSRCGICGYGIHDPLDKEAAHIDHKLPVSAGGDSSVENLQLAHAICNLMKGDRREYHTPLGALPSAIKTANPHEGIYDLAYCGLAVSLESKHTIYLGTMANADRAGDDGIRRN